MTTVFRSIKPDFVDDRGEIIKVLDDGKTVIRSVLLITCKKDSIRANHYHRKDSHFSYLLSGRMEYTEQPVDVNGKPQGKKETVILEAGDMVYSAPMVIHAMRFLEDSAFLALATESRHHAAYEEDTVRIKLV